MTAYLSLVFILLVTFIGGMIESASVQNAKNYQRADMNRAIVLSDAYYGDGSSIVYLYRKTGKRIMIQNQEVLID